MMKYIITLFAVSITIFKQCLSASGKLIIDNYKVRAISDFQKVCPYVELCSSLSRTASSLDSLCCRPCICSMECGYDCCPDQPERFVIPDVAAQIRQSSCVQASFPENPNVYWDHPDNHIMITACPYKAVGRNLPLENCQRSYNDFEFSEHQNYFQPVSSPGFALPFKNKYCAECHGVSEAEINPWSMLLRCKTFKPLKIEKIQDIPGMQKCVTIVMKNRIWNCVGFIDDRFGLVTGHSK